MRRKTRKVETMDEVVKGIMAEGGGRGGLEGFARQLVSTGRMLRLTVLRETTILTSRLAYFVLNASSFVRSRPSNERQPHWAMGGILPRAIGYCPVLIVASDQFVWENVGELPRL